MDTTDLFCFYYIYNISIFNNRQNLFISYIYIFFLFLRQNLYHMEKESDLAKKAATTLYLTKENAAELDAYCKQIGIRKKDFIPFCLRYINYHGIDLADTDMSLKEQDRLNLPALKTEVEDAVALIKQLPMTIVEELMKVAQQVRANAINEIEAHNAVTAARDSEERKRIAEDFYQKARTENILLKDKLERTEEWLQSSEENLKKANLRISNLSRQRDRLIGELKTAIDELNRSDGLFKRPNQSIIRRLQRCIAEIETRDGESPA